MGRDVEKQGQRWWCTCWCLLTLYASKLSLSQFWMLVSSCAHTLLIAFVAPQRMSVIRPIWWTAWWLAPVDEECSKAIHSSEKQLSPTFSPIPWACIGMSPRPCLNARHSLQSTYTTRREWWDAQTRSHLQKEGSQMIRYKYNHPMRHIPEMDLQEFPNVWKNSMSAQLYNRKPEDRSLTSNWQVRPIKASRLTLQ